MKVSYLICHGLAPFYKETIMKQLIPKGTEPPYFASCFDEAFNGVVSNQKQLGEHRTYFNEHWQRTQNLFHFSIYGSGRSI